MEYIRDSILNNQLSDIIDVSNVKWELCNEAGCKSLVKEVCDYWRKNNDITTVDIANIFQLDRSTIISYLKKGTINGWCNYDAKESLLESLDKHRKSIDYNTVKNVCADWNSGLNNGELCEKYHLSSPTILTYLKIGVDNKWCDYSKKKVKKEVRHYRH